MSLLQSFLTGCFAAEVVSRSWRSAPASCPSLVSSSPVPSHRFSPLSLASTLSFVRIPSVAQWFEPVLQVPFFGSSLLRLSRAWVLISPSVGCVCLYLLVSPLLTFCNRLLFHSAFVALGPFTCSMLQQIIIVLVFLALRCMSVLAVATGSWLAPLDESTLAQKRVWGPSVCQLLQNADAFHNTRSCSGDTRMRPECMYTTVADRSGKEVAARSSGDPKRRRMDSGLSCSPESIASSESEDAVQGSRVYTSPGLDCERKDRDITLNRTLYRTCTGSSIRTLAHCGEEEVSASSRAARKGSFFRGTDGSSFFFCVSRQPSSVAGGSNQPSYGKTAHFFLEFFPCFSCDTFLDCAPLALPYALMLAFSNRCLYTSQLSGYHVARCSCIPLQLLLELLGAGDKAISSPVSMPRHGKAGTSYSEIKRDVLRAAGSEPLVEKRSSAEVQQQPVRLLCSRLLRKRKGNSFPPSPEAVSSSVWFPLFCLPSSWSRYYPSLSPAGTGEQIPGVPQGVAPALCPIDDDSLPTLLAATRCRAVQSPCPPDRDVLPVDVKKMDPLPRAQDGSARSEVRSAAGSETFGLSLSGEESGLVSSVLLFSSLLLVPIRSLVARSAWARLLSREGIRGRLEELQVSRRRLLASLCVSLGFLLLTAEGRKLSVEGAAMGLGASFFGALYMQMSSRIVKRIRGATGKRLEDTGQVSVARGEVQGRVCEQPTSKKPAGQRAHPGEAEAEEVRTQGAQREAGRRGKEVEARKRQTEAAERGLLGLQGTREATPYTCVLQASRRETVQRGKLDKELLCKCGTEGRRRDDSLGGEERRTVKPSEGDRAHVKSTKSAEAGNCVERKVARAKGNFEVRLALHSAAAAAALLSPLALFEHLCLLQGPRYSLLSGSALPSLASVSSSVLPGTSFSPLSPFFVPTTSVSSSLFPLSASSCSFNSLAFSASGREGVCSSLGLLFLSGLLAAVMPLTSYVCFRHLSPLSCCIVGFLKSSGQILLAPLLAREGAPSPPAAVAAGVCLLGCGVYAYDSYCRIAENEDAQDTQAEATVSKEKTSR